MNKATSKVRIYKPHTHAGKRIQPGPEGAEIEVTASQLEWLRRNGLTTRPQAAAEEAAPAEGKAAPAIGAGLPPPAIGK